MTKIIKSLFVILAVAAIAVGVTTAAWTDSETVDQNVFETGTLDLATNPTTALFTATNIYPGWTDTQTIDVINSGTVDFEYTITSSKDSGNNILWNAPEFTCHIQTGGGVTLYNGPMNAVSVAARNLAASATETLTFTVALDSTAANNLQGRTVTVDFDFDATQP